MIKCFSGWWCNCVVNDLIHIHRDVIPHIVHAFPINIQDIVDNALLCQDKNGDMLAGGIPFQTRESALMAYSYFYKNRRDFLNGFSGGSPSRNHTQGPGAWI